MNLSHILDEPYWAEMERQIRLSPDTESLVEDNNDYNIKDFLRRKIESHSSPSPYLSPLVLSSNQSLHNVKDALISYFFKSYLCHLSPVIVTGGRSLTKKENWELIEKYQKDLISQNNIQSLFDLCKEIHSSYEYRTRSIMDFVKFKKFIKSLETIKLIQD